MSFYVRARPKGKKNDLFLSSNSHKLTSDGERRAWFTTAKAAAAAKQQAAANYALVAPWLRFSVEKRA